MFAQWRYAAAMAGGPAAMAARAAALASHLRRVDPRRFRQLIGRVELAFDLLRDAATRRYPHVPWKTVASLAAALTYFVTPIDALPDFIPLTGFLDDAAVLGLVFGAAEFDLRRYCAWRGIDADAHFGG